MDHEPVVYLTNAAYAEDQSPKNLEAIAIIARAMDSCMCQQCSLRDGRGCTPGHVIMCTEYFIDNILPKSNSAWSRLANEYLKGVHNGPKV